ncbi:MAG: hypothetical protein M1546_22755 [Chloroflexi bacterium]|nr:hypothetical protein [Chloroflexota bacterium]
MKAWHRRLMIVAIAMALSCVAFGTTPANPGAASPRAPATEVPLYVFRVYVSDIQAVTRLIAGGWDVLETRGPDYLLVMGDETVATQLRAQGFSLEVDHALGVKVTRTPFAYYGGYRTVAEHYQHMDEVATLHPGLAMTVTYGISWLRQQSPTAGYDLRAICITKRRPGDCALSPDTDKPRFFLMAAIHARELTTAELAWRWIDTLVNGYDVDPEITALLDHNEMWVVPVTNPDGRSIVEAGGDLPYLQRKNANNTAGACFDPPTSWNQYGIDLNRNASFQWVATPGAECDQTYSGISAASEPEESALEDLMKALFHDQRGSLITDTAPLTTSGVMVTLHSYGNLVLLPWGWTQCDYYQLCPVDKQAPNDTGLRELAFRMSYFNAYATGQSSEMLYAASGTTDDWAYGVLGIPGYTFEVGPAYSDPCGDFLPAYACQDSTFWPLNKGAFLYAAKAARQPYALALGPSAQTSVTTIAAPISATVTMTAVIASDLYGDAGVGRPVARTVSAAEYYIDTPPWVAGSNPISMTGQDGAFDSTTEVVSATAEMALMCAGRHTLFVHGRDANGHWGPVTAQWLDIAVPSGDYYCLTAQPDHLSQNASPGSTVTYSVQLTNWGTVSDTIDLTITSNTWQTHPMSDVIGPLAASTTTHFLVRVSIPPDAQGQSDTAQLTVRSRNDASKVVTISLVTSATRLYYFPLIYR